MATTLSLARCRTLVRVHDRLGRLHQRGFRWVKNYYLPCLRRLEKSSGAGDKRLAGRGWRELGRVFDLNGTPRAALRAFQRWQMLEVANVEPWRAIAAMHEAMGEYQRARLALMRAERLSPRHDGVAIDLERVVWLWTQGYPSLYEERSLSWRFGEELAAGRAARALRLVAHKRAAPYRQLRARVFGTRDDGERVLAEWQAVAKSARRIELYHADWFYSFQGDAAEDPRLWRLLLWKVRPKLESGGFFCSPSLGELDVPEVKRFELHVRFELARAEADVTALLALAGSYPSWREPGEAALRIGRTR